MLIVNIQITVEELFTNVECTVSSDRTWFALPIQYVNIYFKDSYLRVRSNFPFNEL